MFRDDCPFPTERPPLLFYLRVTRSDEHPRDRLTRFSPGGMAFPGRREHISAVAVRGVAPVAKIKERYSNAETRNDTRTGESRWAAPCNVIQKTTVWCRRR